MKGDTFETLHVSLLIPKSSASTSGNRTGTWSFMRPRYLEKTAPCSARCPCGEDIPRIEMLASRGRFDVAWRTILAENPLPGSCGRVCFHPCEGACNRGDFDEPVSINALERCIDAAAFAGGLPAEVAVAAPTGRRVAIVGSGPAGLSAAYFLARLGYGCEVFEAGDLPGGVLATGIPAYRLPGEVLAREVKRIEGLGVKIHRSTPIGPDFVASARNRGQFDAVFLACGNGKSARLGIPGEELAMDGLEFLARVRRGEISQANPVGKGGSAAKGGSAIVVGGGNSAVDVARSLLRAGVAATIAYRRRREDMPAFGHEIARALEEGVSIVELISPLAIARKGMGIELTLQKMKTSAAEPDGRMGVEALAGQTSVMAADAIYAAVGASPAEAWMLPSGGKGVLRLSHCAAQWHSQAGLPLLYGGDTVDADESVADAIASGKQAAIALDAYFAQGESSVEAEIERCCVGDGKALSMEIHLGGPRLDRAKKVVRFEDLNADYFSPSATGRGASIPAADSVGSFDEIESALDADAGLRQAERCFNCGICNDCDNCRTYCPEAAVFAARASRKDDWTAEACPDRKVDSDYCKGCGICVTECPRAAMIIEEQQS
jgi:NADPH-dependent glutamate synthase beta subunit-like oxidoreductase/Pyruvate/2-oxoacid:ferredoxin oxidoreductase delta subunit